MKFLVKLTMKYEVLDWLITARSDHRHFAAYCGIFQFKEKTNLYCICEQKRAQLHLFNCYFRNMYRALLKCRKIYREFQPKEVWKSLKSVAVFAQ